MFKVLSSWTPPIRYVQPELYLSEIEDKLININESGTSYPNLSKDEREALKSLMNDNEIVIKVVLLLYGVNMIIYWKHQINL